MAGRRKVAIPSKVDQVINDRSANSQKNIRPHGGNPI